MHACLSPFTSFCPHSLFWFAHPIFLTSLPPVVKVKLRSNSIILDFDWSCMSALGLLINLFSISLGRRGRFPLCVGYAVHLGGRVLIRFELVSSPAARCMDALHKPIMPYVRCLSWRVF